ncbi:tryptophan 7-halogenase [Caulobacter endophyticus]|uniref:Tryptophan halogenase n=1 Tax=Caulobacter endophyticus TaxID=2172652 RepID=A0A2T9K1E8_9CAUL|nr:tryptophan 7-halogenase [Caulobacter endophyticus]PVM89808.1 tryptophan halogenase [Caulobacter endophyticus]
MSRPVRTVVVAGAGAPLWLATLALRKAFGAGGLAVLAVETAPPTPGLSHAGLPAMGNLHQLLGLSEVELSRRCGAVPSLGQRFAGFSGDGSAFLHPYDTHGHAVDYVDFVHHWVLARKRGLKTALEDFSLGAAAAKQGRIVEGDDPGRLSSPGAGLHVDAAAYATLLRQRALVDGVTVEQGALADIERSGERIDAVVLESGARIAGDLFVDVGDGALIGQMPGAAFESWARWLPFDRVLPLAGQRLKTLPAYAHIEAVEGGWIGLYPLQDRTAGLAVYDSRTADAGLMARRAEGVSPLGWRQGEAQALRPGMQTRPWIGNCVALGAAAIALDPSDAAPMHAFQAGLSHLVSLFPADAGGGAEAPEARAYGAALAAQGRGLRDFQAMHYNLNRRAGAPWEAVRESEPPAELAYRLRLFGARGVVPAREDEAFQPANWAACLIGHGLIPQAHDPLAEGVAEAEQIQIFQNILGRIAADVGRMRPLEARLASLASRPAASAPAPLRFT